MSRSKRQRGRQRGPAVPGPPKGGRSAPEIQLLKSPVFAFLVLDVRAHRCFVTAHGRGEGATRTEMLADENALALALDPGQMNRTLALDVAN